MRYLSVCSGIEAASVAWAPLGWECVGVSEIEPFPCSVLAHHYPTVKNFGDMTRHESWSIEPGSVDILVGGTPCQSFSVAGKRAGLGDPRGQLVHCYLDIARRLRPRWIVWENVPGVLSSGGGRDFGSLLGALGQLGYEWAYRVLDAQWVRTRGHPRAVPQRRRRVFVVGCLAAGRAAQVLFERQSVLRDSAAKRPTRKKTPGDVAPCLTSGNDPSRSPQSGEVTAQVAAVVGAGSWPAAVASTLDTSFAGRYGCENQHALGGAALFVPAVIGALHAKGPTAMGAPEVNGHHYVVAQPREVAHTLRGGGFDASEDGSGRGTPLVPVAPPASTALSVPAVVDAQHHMVAQSWDGADVSRTLTRKACDDRMPDKGRLFAVVVSAVAPLQDCRPTEKGQNGSGIGAIDAPAYTLDTVSVPGVIAVGVPDVAATLGASNARQPNAVDGNGAYIAVAFAQNVRDEVRLIGGDGQIAGALSAEGGTHQTTYVSQPVPYDLFQITAPLNRQSRQPGDPCHTLARDNAAHAAIVHGAVAPASTPTGASGERVVGMLNMQGGKGFAGFGDGTISPTLCSPNGADVHAVAFSSNMSEPDCRTDGTSPTIKCGSSVGIPSPPAVAMAFKTGNSAKARSNAESTAVSPTLAVGGGNSVPGVALTPEPATITDIQQEGTTGHVITTTPNTVQILWTLRGAVGEETFTRWGLGVLVALYEAEVLWPGVHGESVRPAPFSCNWPIYCTLSRPEDRTAGAVQSVREAQGERCPPPGWQLPEQLARELGAYLSELPQPSAQAKGFLRDLWSAGEGIGLLHQALLSFQAARQSALGGGEPASPGATVRRLTPQECEFLMGFPKNYTLIPFRGKLAADGPRYRALGNSMAVNVVAWIGERLQAVDSTLGCTTARDG